MKFSLKKKIVLENNSTQDFIFLPYFCLFVFCVHNIIIYYAHKSLTKIQSQFYS